LVTQVPQVENGWDSGADVSEAYESDSTGEVTSWDADHDGILAGVRSVMPEMKVCYEAWAAVQPGLAGRLVLGLTIRHDDQDADTGHVARVDVEDSDLDNALMEGCVAGALEGLRFKGMGAGGIKIRFPFQFRDE